MTYSPISPAHIGPAMLRVLKQGRPVERITVWFTHGQLHRIFHGETDLGYKIRSDFPLEIVLAEGTLAEQKIDCRLSLAPWHIDVRTKKEKKAARVPFEVPDPTPPAPDPTPEEQKANAAAFALLEPYLHRAELEYRLSIADLQRKSLMEKLVPRPQAPTEDTAHAR